MMYKHLFGPVPSRRLGVSLGIDLTPERSCTFNCVYCECGRTDELTLERREYVPTGEVIEELRAYLSTAPHLDSITFSGSGEPTMHTGIGSIIAMLKEEFPRYRVTVLTNSSLLHLEEVREALMPADLVIPSLDAISEAAFLRVNRPARGVTCDDVLTGLRAFCTEYPGEIWLEIFIVPGVNDTDEELKMFREEIGRLNAKRVQLNTLDRPGAVQWIAPAPYERLEEIARFFGRGAEVVASRHSRVRSRSHDTLTDDGRAVGQSHVNADDLAHMEDPILRAQIVRDRILATVFVRPCTLDDLVRMLDLPENDVSAVLDWLITDERVVTRDEAAGRFYLGRTGHHISTRS